MSRTLPGPIDTAKDLQSTSSAWLILMDVVYNSSTLYRFINNTEDVVYDGNTYSAMGFGLAPVDETIRGDLPITQLTIFDTELSMNVDLQANDGLSGGRIYLRRVLVTQTGVVTDTGILLYFDIMDVSYADENGSLVFNIGISTPLTNRFPRDRYVSNICRHRFGFGLCRYNSGITAIEYPLLNMGASGDGRGEISSPSKGLDLLFPVTGSSLSYTVRISGSVYNDRDYTVTEVLTDGSRIYVSEGLSSTSDPDVIITVLCDHTIGGCRGNNNSVQWGGSPGVSEGIYG